MLAFAAVVFAGVLPLASAAPGSGARPGVRAVDSAIEFREKLGFRSDRAYVAETFGDQRFSKAEWGIPLDPGEAAELGRRAKVQKDAAPAIRQWAKDPSFAGAYFDQGSNGAPVILTTGDPTRARSSVAQKMPAAANARFVRVQHSMTDLVDLQARLDADLRAGDLAALGVTSTAIDARANAVAVGVAADSPDVVAALRERYGEAVAVRLELPAQGGDACSGRTNCAPAKGGIQIDSTYNSNYCTVGFLVRVVGSSEPRLLTAGHCVGKSGGTGTSRTWKHHGTTIGWSEITTWADGADADAALITPSTGAVSGARNLVYRASTGDIASITGWQDSGSQIQGGLVCRGAAVSNYHCGTITLTNRTKDVDGHVIDHQWVVDFDACPGDSGAPYLLDGVAYGIHSDSTTGCDPSKNEAWYSPIGWVLDSLASKNHPVELCTTATCGSEINVWTQRESLGDTTWGPKLVPLADGRVLKAGGAESDILGVGGAATTPTPEVFDPATGAWTDTATPPWSPAQCDGQWAVRLQNGNVLVGGGKRVGSGGSPSACDGAHIYDPDNGPGGSWSNAASPPTRLQSAGAALLGDGRAFVTGGSGTSGATSVAMAYDPGDDDWDTLAPAPAGAFAPLVLPLSNGRILVSGGYVIANASAPGYKDVTGTYIYNPGSNSWATTSSVGARGVSGVVLGNGRVVLAGGQHLSWNGSQHSSFVTAVSRYDPSSGSWTQLAPLRTARAAFTLLELDNGMLLAAGGIVSGGSSGTPSKTADAWNPSGNAWSAAPGLKVSHGNQGSATLDDGRVLVAGGGTTATETYVLGDILPPGGNSAPSLVLRSSTTMGTPSVPIQLSWGGASDSGGAGTGTYEVARSKNGGAFTTIATRVTGTTYSTTVDGNNDYRFQVRPRDWAGNFGPWKVNSELRISVTQQSSSSISYSSGWKTGHNDAYSGDSVKYASAAGKSASYTFTGRGIAWVSTRGPARGSAKVYIDGSLAATVSLSHSSVSHRYVAFQQAWSSVGKHTISIVVSGTSGHPRVDIDAFEVIRNP